eukprot:g14446.t1
MSDFMSLADIKRDLDTYLARTDVRRAPMLGTICQSAWTIFERRYGLYLDVVGDADAYTKVTCILAETRRQLSKLINLQLVTHRDGGDGVRARAGNEDEWLAAIDRYWTEHGLSRQTAKQLARNLPRPKATTESITNYLSEFDHILVHTPQTLQDNRGFRKTLVEIFVRGLPGYKLRELVRDEIREQEHDMGLVSRATLDCLRSHNEAKQLLARRRRRRRRDDDTDDESDYSDDEAEHSDDDDEGDEVEAEPVRDKRRNGKRTRETVRQDKRSRRQRQRDRRAAAQTGDKSPKDKTQRPGPGACYFCHQLGHRVANCPALAAHHAQTQTQMPQRQTQ